MIVKKTTLQETLNWSAFNLNQRERLGRPTPHEVLIEPATQINIEKQRERRTNSHIRLL